MNSRILSTRSKTASRRLLAALALFSLNLAAIPCTMALEAAAPGTGHCPPQSAPVTTHADHHQMAVEEDCISLQSDCCSVDGVAVETRGTDKLQKDGHFLVSDSPAWPTLQAHPVPVDEFRPPDITVSFPPLHVLNCVYLD